MIKIALVAACDRNNYGDILLPIIIEEYVTKTKGNNDCSFEYFGLSESDMKAVGGKKTKALLKIDDTYDVVIIAGGEVMSARYVNMYMNLQTNDYLILMYKIIRRVSYELCDCICKKKLGGVFYQPWIFNKKKRTQKVFYNAVGGANDLFNKKQMKEWAECIDKSEMFSVRGNESYDFLCKRMKKTEKVKLIPDNAVIMADVFGESLESKCSKIIIDMIKRQPQYLVVQVNKLYGSSLVDELASLINYIDKQVGVKTILLPIGRAQGHEDEIPLNAINKKAQNSSILINNNNIYDIMYIIKNCKCFLGTSLHGMVTAASFEVPHIGISENAVKLLDYLETWKTTNVFVLKSKEQLAEFFNNDNFDSVVNFANIRKMKAEVKDYLDKQYSMIIGDTNNGYSGKSEEQV